MTETSGVLKLGRPIISPRASDRKQLARDLKISRYDIASLATANYHGNEDGVQMLTEQYIHDCGYTSLSPESPEDVLICYRDIIMLHRKVIDGWVNHRTGRTGPSMEYILEKALVHFPKLKTLEARKGVEFYTSCKNCQWATFFRLCPLIRSSFPSTSKVSARRALARSVMPR